MSSVEVDPATVPELAAILRAGLRSKARLFEAVCGGNHRLVEVLRVGGRPLALGIDTTILHGDRPKSWRHLPTSSDEWVPDRRGRWLGLWLDVDGDPDHRGTWAVTVTPEEGRHVVQDGQGPVERYTFTCARNHCTEPISLAWLRKQVGSVASTRRRRVVLDDKIRYAMREEPGG